MLETKSKTALCVVTYEPRLEARLEVKELKVSVKHDLPKEAREKRAELAKQARNLRQGGLKIRVREREV